MMHRLVPFELSKKESSKSYKKASEKSVYLQNGMRKSGVLKNYRNAINRYQSVKLNQDLALAKPARAYQADPSMYQTQLQFKLQRIGDEPACSDQTNSQ
mmetsp:Transcript_15148/g.20555  ORF Transcript_15148/g.20555 Transcript_15148/m.20555 type:complete len:99 (+) Transcript_15148:470-766(+)|eukprot:CAMPEP_0185578526 /NCGR_PEP_ID=MMETSP0434-20130131/12982_1 /TAXON_ID=626734 ORGANISM="Favella taraikaensis, Strain Fe Narragansett Bay" /NCGR_SAMPLE_ID=MMETSP0434 /ASSEMBLY_ACC=CAM_ASM_000379 /LENGTH=98 /DNA_ID=CAMNT_0028196345 /DNA_START=446 /DNA_END=742 /DNA_ORIENTATION=-